MCLDHAGTVQSARSLHTTLQTYETIRESWYATVVFTAMLVVYVASFRWSRLTECVLVVPAAVHTTYHHQLFLVTFPVTEIGSANAVVPLKTHTFHGF